MTTIPKRRGRPPATPQTAAASPVMQALNASGVESDDPAQIPDMPTTRRRRASVGGFHLKLSAPQRPGFVRRWFNDKPGRIAEAEELAYSHVQESGIKSDSPDSRVRRLVGTQDGQALYAYLMETPIQEYKVGEDEREETHRQVDQAIRDGRAMDTGRISNEYGEGSIG